MRCPPMINHIFSARGVEGTSQEYEGCSSAKDCEGREYLCFLGHSDGIFTVDNPKIRR